MGTLRSVSWCIIAILREVDNRNKTVTGRCLVLLCDESSCTSKESFDDEAATGIYNSNKCRCLACNFEQHKLPKVQSSHCQSDQGAQARSIDPSAACCLHRSIGPRKLYLHLVGGSRVIHCLSLPSVQSCAGHRASELTAKPAESAATALSFSSIQHTSVRRQIAADRGSRKRRHLALWQPHTPTCRSGVQPRLALWCRACSSE